MTLEKLFTDPLGLFDELANGLQGGFPYENSAHTLQEYRDIIAAHEPAIQTHLVYSYICHLVNDVYHLQ